MSNPPAQDSFSHQRSSIPARHAHPAAPAQSVYAAGMNHGATHAHAAPYYGQSGLQGVGNAIGLGSPQAANLSGMPASATRSPYPGWNTLPGPPQYDPARVRLPASRAGSTLSVTRPALAGNHTLLSSPLGDGARRYPGSQQSAVLPANYLLRLAATDSTRSAYARYTGVTEPDSNSQYTQCPDCGNLYNRSDSFNHEDTCAPRCPICERTFRPDNIVDHTIRCNLRRQAQRVNAANAGAAENMVNTPETLTECESDSGYCTSWTTFEEVPSGSQYSWRSPGSSRRSQP